MSEPEIARRCLNCGAAVRGRASFCPQCGQSMSDAPTLNRPTADAPRPQASALVDEAERVARELSERVPPAPMPAAGSADGSAAAPERAPGDASSSRPLASAAVTQSDSGARPVAAQAHSANADVVVGADAEQAAGGGARFERAAGVRARAGERVERLREASIV
ncbi:MAG TPA: zinc ribbon domain-containing protein, partial [Pyrinomonadaceae bacterium]|nr:zinc ribbon domain-containing protein [Pyrinomonadaceae bacterium]